MYGKLKTECHKIVDEIATDRKTKRLLYRYLAKKMHINGLHFSKMDLEQLLHARRILKGLRSKCPKL